MTPPHLPAPAATQGPDTLSRAYTNRRLPWWDLEAQGKG
jgi:hypothetical protein